MVKGEGGEEEEKEVGVTAAAMEHWKVPQAERAELGACSRHGVSGEEIANAILDVAWSELRRISRSKVVVARVCRRRCVSSEAFALKMLQVGMSEIMQRYGNLSRKH